MQNTSTTILAEPRTIRILVVTDGEASFDRADFGLVTLLDTLATPPGPWVRFDVTRAHRERNLPAQSAQIPEFRFDQHD
ncbi:hypothetical protein [Actinophytocola oryzae]|uniref:Uncharacterized protein n=1 Tax=Actinophytocola oryzae TaxID=502181 RepID=A0A4V3FV87_9PSEU|nr:hypothetical protein [Actinophytocola oryzae]TDV57931.1 hypothetical protein CLV71_101805 [Actinophytocola oryzae]